MADVNEPISYSKTENRVTIYTDYECVRIYETYDSKTAVCAELATGIGNLVVYGTIIGIRGKTDPRYKEELARQLDDISRLCTEGHCVCLIGDYNCSFADNYYFTAHGRETMLAAFTDNNMTLLTKGLAESIDHIALSDRYLKGADVQIQEWNLDKRLSDHKGVAVEIEL